MVLNLSAFQTNNNKKDYLSIEELKKAIPGADFGSTISKPLNTSAFKNVSVGETIRNQQKAMEQTQPNFRTGFAKESNISITQDAPTKLVYSAFNRLPELLVSLPVAGINFFRSNIKTLVGSAMGQENVFEKPVTEKQFKTLLGFDPARFGITQNDIQDTWSKAYQEIQKQNEINPPKNEIDSYKNSAISVAKTIVPDVLDALFGLDIATGAKNLAVGGVKLSFRQLPDNLLFKIQQENISPLAIRDALSGSNFASAEEKKIAEDFIKKLSQSERTDLFRIAKTYEQAGTKIPIQTGIEQTAIGKFAGAELPKLPKLPPEQVALLNAGKLDLQAGFLDVSKIGEDIKTLAQKANSVPELKNLLSPKQLAELSAKGIGVEELYNSLKVESENNFLENNAGKKIDGITIPKGFKAYRRTITGEDVDINRLKTDTEYFKKAYESTFARGFRTDEKLYKILTKNLVPQGREPSGYLTDLYKKTETESSLAQEARKYKSASDFIESIRRESNLVKNTPEQSAQYLKDTANLPKNNLANEAVDILNKTDTSQRGWFDKATDFYNQAVKTTSQTKNVSGVSSRELAKTQKELPQRQQTQINSPSPQPIISHPKNIEKDLSYKSDIPPANKIVKDATIGRNVPTKQVINKSLGINQPKETITQTQKQLLTRIESASKLGSKAGQREAKISITNQLRNTFDTKLSEVKRANELNVLKTNIKTRDFDRVRNEIVDYIKENIPIGDRGVFLNMVKDAKTQRDLTNAFTRIDKKANEVSVKESLSKLKNTLEKISDNNSISADYRNKVKDIINNYELSGHNQTTIDKIKALQDFINRQESIGIEVELPQRMIDKLKILERTPKDQLTFEKIQTLQSEVELLAKLGETKWASKQALYDAEKNYRKQELLDAVSPINSREVRTIGFEKQPAKYLQTYFKWRNYLQKTRIGLTPIEGLADITGMTPMKNVMDLNFGNYLSYNDDIVKQWYDLTKEFDETNFKRIGAYSISQQTGGAERLIANNNMTQEIIDNLELTPEEKKAYNFARDTFDSEFPAVKKYALDNYNKDVGEVKNYVSFMSDNDALNELEMYDRFGTGPENTRNTKTVEQGFTEKRANMAGNPLELNIDKIFRRHIDDVAYMLTTGKDIKQYFEIVNSPEMREKLGDVGATAWLQYLDLLARKGGSEGAKRIAILDTIRQNLAAGVLSFRISSALVQFTSFADTLGTIGTEWGMKGASSIATSKEWRDFIMDNFPEVRKAIGDDIAFREFGDGFISKVAQKGLKPLEMLDGLMRSTAAAGGYAKEMASRGLEIDFKNPNKDAIQAATKTMRQSQGSSFFKDQPLSLTTNYGLTDNKSLNKTILTFQSFMLARWDNMWRQMWRMGIKEKSYGKAFMSFFWMVIIATTLEESIRRGVKYGVGKTTEFITGNEDKTNYGSFLGNSVMNLVQSIPIMGQLVSSMEYSSNPVPTINTLEQIQSGASSVWGGKALQTKIRGGITTAGALGSVLGFPGSSQASQIVKGFVPPANSKKSNTNLPKLPPLPKLPKLPPLPKLK